MDGLDKDGQPLSRGLSWHRLGDSRMDELIGLCRGLMADGLLVFEEVEFLYDWLSRNEPVQATPFGNKLFKLLETTVKRGRLHQYDEDRLVTIIMDLIGGTPSMSGAASHSSRLPIDDPPPDITWPGRSFCFTGKFEYGTRKECETTVTALGGSTQTTPTKSTDYLVVGDIGSRDWAHSTHGRKIEKALELKLMGHDIFIVHEDHWRSTLPDEIDSNVIADRNNTSQEDLDQHVLVYILTEHDIDHLGKTAIFSLQQHFGDVKSLAEASIEEIVEVQGIGRKKAESIYRFFQSDPGRDVLRELYGTDV